MLPDANAQWMIRYEKPEADPDVNRVQTGNAQRQSQSPRFYYSRT